MQFSIAIAAIFATATTTVLADSCNRGGVYCGSSLLRKGNYRDHIVETLTDEGVSTDEMHVQNALFNCLDDGDIMYTAYCIAGCGGTDSEDPDYCF
ncbi:hypothetical protein F4808DRAFT_464641 [Astrocystis sublimbata]|nr:hypothetical protein F4808DRAFT_464641 [Astrocystis sublimbata]